MSEIIPVLLLGLHLMAMNVATGGPLVGVWLEWREQKGDRLATLAADYLAKAVSYSLLAGIFLGLALGWWSWSANYQSIWIGRLHYKLVWGVGELVFSLLITVGYLQWRKSGKGRNGVYRWLRSGLLVLNGTNLLYHFPSLFLLAGQLMATSELTGADLRGAAFRERVATDGIPALVVHFGLASLAMGGMVLLGLSLRLLKQLPAEEAQSLSQRAAIWGGMIALSATIVQLPVGLWVLSSSTAALRSQLMGQHPVAAICFLISLPLALWLTQILVTIAMGETQRKELVKAMVAMVLVVMLMTAAHRLGMKGAAIDGGAPANPTTSQILSAPAGSLQ